jgi:hypothetical protein
MHKKLLHWYFLLRNSSLIWPILNKKGNALFKADKPVLTEKQQQILLDMKKNGIAVTDLETLFPGENLLQKFNTFKDTLNPEEAVQGKKSFLKKYWDKFPLFDITNPFVAFSLSKPVLSLVNSYMEQYTILKYYDLAKTLPVGDSAEAVQSQRWHRDPEEKMMVKVFVYLNDVDTEAGPFIYAYESQEGGKFGKLFPQETPLGVYPDKAELEKAIPKENIHTMTGKAGTVIFCNTAGLHKGGFAKTKERIMFTAFFSASTYSEAPLYSIPKNSMLEKLSPEAQFALSQAKVLN